MDDMNERKPKTPLIVIFSVTAALLCLLGLLHFLIPDKMGGKLTFQEAEQVALKIIEDSGTEGGFTGCSCESDVYNRHLCRFTEKDGGQLFVVFRYVPETETYYWHPELIFRADCSADAVKRAINWNSDSDFETDVKALYSFLRGLSGGTV